MFSVQGSTLIELLVAVMVVGLIVTAVAITVTNSIKNTGEARFKQVATSLGQEVIEFVRSEKNRIGVENLKNTLAANTYCFNTLPADLSVSPASGACGSATFPMAGVDFKREAVVTISSNPTVITLVVTVYWNDGATVKSVELEQRLQQANTDY